MKHRHRLQTLKLCTPSSIFPTILVMQFSLKSSVTVTSLLSCIGVDGDILVSFVAGFAVAGWDTFDELCNDSTDRMTTTITPITTNTPTTAAPTTTTPVRLRHGRGLAGSELGWSKSSRESVAALSSSPRRQSSSRPLSRRLSSFIRQTSLPVLSLHSTASSLPFKLALLDMLKQNTTEVSHTFFDKHADKNHHGQNQKYKIYANHCCTRLIVLAPRWRQLINSN